MGSLLQKKRELVQLKLSGETLVRVLPRRRRTNVVLEIDKKKEVLQPLRRLFLPSRTCSVCKHFYL